MWQQQDFYVNDVGIAHVLIRFLCRGVLLLKKDRFLDIALYVFLKENKPFYIFFKRV